MGTGQAMIRLIQHYNWWVVTRPKNTERFQKGYIESRRNMVLVFQQKIFGIFSNDFRSVPGEKCKKLNRMYRKNPENSRPEYCHHVPVPSRVFLKDLLFFHLFSAGFSGIWWLESLPCVKKVNTYIGKCPDSSWILISKRDYGSHARVTSHLLVFFSVR